MTVVWISMCSAIRYYLNRDVVIFLLPLWYTVQHSLTSKASKNESGFLTLTIILVTTSYNGLPLGRITTQLYNVGRYFRGVLYSIIDFKSFACGVYGLSTH